MALGARRFILELLSAAPEGEFSIARLLEAGALFDLPEGGMRVAVTRLRAEGLLVASSRGRYRLGAHALDLALHVASWRRVLRSLRPWKGAWIGAVGSAPARARDRVLALTGMHAIDHGLLVRPDNLDGGAEGLATRLGDLGFDGRVFGIDWLDAAGEARARAGWDRRALDRGYATCLKSAERATDRLATLPLPRACRLAFEAGSAAIRTWVFDPRLPEAFIDADLRARAHEASLTLDGQGRALWAQFLQMPLARAPLVDARSLPARRVGSATRGVAQPA